MSGPAATGDRSTVPGADAVQRAEAILRTVCGDRVRTEFSLAAVTTFRIGGPSALYLEPESELDLRAAGEAVGEIGVPFAVIGKGSNLLVSDAGFSGLVLRLGKGFRWSARDGERLSGGGAIPLPALAGVALTHGLSGLEFGVAIPASLGGSVRMNAGAHGHELAEVLHELDVFYLREGRPRTMRASDASFRYRASELPDDAVVISATMGLVRGDRDEIRARMDAARDWRRRTQPIAEPNCGSVFKNPAGAHAAQLIEEAGGKGLAVGGASVSMKHANFIVASPGTRATDVALLIRRLQELVSGKFGIHLEPEVHFLGDFGEFELKASSVSR